MIGIAGGGRSSCLGWCSAHVVWSPHTLIGVRVVPTPADNPFVTNAEYWQLLGLFGVITLVCLGGGLIIVAMAVRSRTRHRIRQAALQGDLSVMPLANIRTDTTLSPDVTTQPLELMWRSSKVTGFLYSLLLIVQGLGLFLTVGLMLLGLVLLLVQPTHPLSVWEITLCVAGILALAAVLVGLIIVVVRICPYLFGRPFGVTATDQGIDARTELGTRIHMDWDEARLLEVASGDTQSKRHFDLYAPGKHIKWIEFALGLGAEYVPVGVTTSEMTLRQVALLNLVVARTGMTPRTLAKTLKSRPTPTRTAKHSSNAVALLVLALIMVGIAAAIFFVPVMPVPWMNWVSVGSLALSALILIVASLWTALNQSALPTHAQPPSVGAPSLDAAGVAYVLTWRPPLPRRLALVAIGLCLGINMIPGVWMLLLSFGISLPGYHPQILADGVFAFMARFALAFVLALFGLTGLALAYGGMIAATVRIRADKDGLTTRSGRFQRLMAWSSVQEISWHPGGKGQFTYVVKSDVPTTQISWPAGPEATSAIPPSDGAVPIGADELAALVAARIGKPIQVREGR